MRNAWGHELHFPEDVSYSNELMWVKVEPGNKLRIGISDLGVRAVKILEFVKLKVRAGNQVKKGDLLGMVDTNKMAWEIIAPVSGKVVEVNTKLLSGETTLIIEDNYGAGWVALLEKTSTTDSELQQLHKGEDANSKQWIDEKIEAIIPL